MEKQLLSMGEVVRKTKIPRHQISYALERGFLKEPSRLNGRRCFTADDVIAIQKVLGRKKEGR